jgi:hypothetical protein
VESTDGGGEGIWTNLNPAASISLRSGAAAHQPYGMLSPSRSVGSAEAIDSKVGPVRADPVKRL